MVAKDELLRLLDGLSDAELERLIAGIESRSSVVPRNDAPRPLRRDDILLRESVMPDDETADELIEAVRQWRHAGGYV
jgi:hypothetical protein